MDYDAHDALGLAACVAAGEVSPRELVDEALRRIERIDPQLNAVVHRMDEAARQAAAAPLAEGPFAGVPFLLKDLGASLAGQPLSAGSRLFDGHIPDRDSAFVARLRAAGLITCGKTNVPELGLMPVTEPARWGPCRNPWDLGRTPGGSSGGSAAAVAAGLVPIASGGDGGGSIRIPAAACGLFGLKPTRGRNPAGPVENESWSGCAVEHVLTRSVRDSAAALDATAGPDAGARYHAPPPARPFADEVGADPGRLRIAYTTRPAVPAEVHPDCVAALEATVALCRELGHDVEEAAPPIEAEPFGLAFLTMLCGETAADVRDAERARGRRARGGELEPGTAFLRMLGETLRAGEYAAAVRDLGRAGRQVGAWFTGYDALLTPATGTPPPPIGSIGPRGLQLLMLNVLLALRAGSVLRAMGVLEAEARSAFAFAPFTMLFNVSGNPAASLPLHWNAEGLPIGVQLVTPHGDEATLLRLAAQLEAARPWRERRPPLHAGN